MIYRIDVQTKENAADSVGEALREQIREFGESVGQVTSTRIFLIDCDATERDIQRAADELLADPIIESAQLMSSAVHDHKQSRIEIHLKPGVMDPVAASTEMALRDLGLAVKEVRTGRAYLIDKALGRPILEQIAGRLLANGVIEAVHFEPFLPSEFVRTRQETFVLHRVSLTKLSDEELRKLSRDAHLFLSLAEMQAIQAYFRRQKREPTDVELETIAQTWSEHCVHKTLKSGVEVQVRDGQGKSLGTRRYKNLIKETIFKSTMELMKSAAAEASPFCLSVFADNAGVIAFDESDAVCFKVETHNHPSAIEPYGGSATGIGGVIRDILGTGLGAKPIANTDVFCVADPQYGKSSSTALPRGVIHPRRILEQVVAGVRDYGNRMGIPTVNGAVYFDDRYLGNPLVFCGCVGLIPRDKISKAAEVGDVIVVMGGRTGRDGIHGATFSSAELTDTHADEFSHAVQIGNAITEKKVADVILQARDRNLFTAITDCGAGGLSSAIGEMAVEVGASVELDQVPLKYAGLRYDEIWISEAQERMVLAVPPQHVEALLALAKSEDVEANVIGVFGVAGRELLLNYQKQQVGSLSMEFLHEGIPMPMRTATVIETAPPPSRSMFSSEGDIGTKLRKALANPNIASKHWIIRQYDHEVQGGSVIKPLVGPQQIGPSDAAVIRPKLASQRGVVIGCGMAPWIDDPYWMTIAAIDEAIRNAVAVGGDPARMAMLDNFCWPSVDDAAAMGTLVRACEACYDAAKAFGIPFISGKDSLNNQFTDAQSGQVIRIPNTLLISTIGIIEDVNRCVTMDFKQPGNAVYLVAAKEPWDLRHLAASHRQMAALICGGHVAAVHDCSDGGLLVALAEMCIASQLGFTADGELANAFDELPGRYVVELRDGADKIASQFGGDVSVTKLGKVTEDSSLRLPGEQIAIADLTAAWRGTLDW
jgi:phosphoribosylformylglycinamidine synthase II